MPMMTPDIRDVANSFIALGFVPFNNDIVLHVRYRRLKLNEVAVFIYSEQKYILTGIGVTFPHHPWGASGTTFFGPMESAKAIEYAVEQVERLATIKIDPKEAAARQAQMDRISSMISKREKRLEKNIENM